MIVNSNLQHSQVLKSELDNRVSFDVYQDTEEKKIWELMQGGKDDIYVYDRCGRLAYYIPFPMSIMSTEDGGPDLVRVATIAAYFRSRCGDICDQNGARSSFDEFLSINLDVTTESTTEVISETVPYEMYTPESNISEASLNETASPDNDEFVKAGGNVSYFDSVDDYDYITSNETTDDDKSNETLTRHPIQNELHTIIFGNETFEETQDSNFTSFTNESLANTNQTYISNENPAILNVDQQSIQQLNNQSKHSQSNDTETENTKPNVFVPKKKLDRCAEADLTICKNWSKRRLLRAQTCCTADPESATKSESCKNYGKKRCKKIRTVLKCCIKTEFVEATTMAVTTVMDTTTVPNIDGATEAASNDVICCKELSTGRLCRVSGTTGCESDEFLSEEGVPVDSAPPENTN